MGDLEPINDRSNHSQKPISPLVFVFFFSVLKNQNQAALYKLVDYDRVIISLAKGPYLASRNILTGSYRITITSILVSVSMNTRVNSEIACTCISFRSLSRIFDASHLTPEKTNQRGQFFY